MNSPKNLHIQAWRPGNCSAFPLELLVAYVEKVGYLELKELGTSLYPLLSLSSGLKTTLSIIPIATRVPWVENTHG